ncbi:MBOAT family O-acyltransferase [Rhodoferax ferrireducens]|uniref:MBOAT family O-acyltransferase n=1 Tax=Rhodoferax ferrireducens TaxID=192843 RepID=UPI00298EAAE3|nr:MBOAT family O-acyltransferase [Rhodoferax ferrireducens]WPC65380.1 MBOAT family O-acyltransferase [Rhodoferax ferrireducens]
MLFTSLEFFVFLPLALMLFALLPPGKRWIWLLLASYGFYGALRPFNLVYLGALTLLVWGCGVGLAHTTGERSRRLLLGAGLVVVVGSLVAFKFYDFAAGELERLAGQSFGGDSAISLPRLAITTPVGYSFYAFSAVSYLVDTYARRLPGQHSAGHVALYLAWFPKILAGPIERATTFLPQLSAGLRADPERLVLGLQLIGWGLIKKVVIADNLAPVVDKSFGIAAFASPIDLLISVYFFAFQIYCDFSGYTDIAIGVSLLFGLQLMENFRRPYLAKSTAEFWGERWHISLGRWFRDYLYIPLGGSRTGPVRQYLNLMLVFVASGLWHAGLGYGVGWTFLVWGALNGSYQWAGLATRPFWRRVGAWLPRISQSVLLRALRVLLTFHLIAITWVFFRARTLGDAWLILKKIGLNLTSIPSLLPRFPFTADHYTAFALIAFLISVEIVDERRSIFQRLAAAPVVVRWGLWYLAIFALLILGRWQAREFIYMQF